MVTKLTLSLQELINILESVEYHGIERDCQITLVKRSESGIGYILEVEFPNGPRIKTVIEISGTEDW